MDEASRVFWLKRSFDSVSNPFNDDTLCVPTFLPAPPHHAAGELFFEYYDSIRDWLHDRKQLGLAVVALDEHGVQAKGYLRAHENRVNTAIVGRHEKADIFLGDDPALSLRHLAVIVSPSSPRKPLSFRVVDLRTPSGFTDQHGTHLRSCEADGPFFIRCGRYSLLFAPGSRDGSGWPDEPEDVWASLRHRDAAALSLPHPATLEDGLLSDDEEPLGELVIASEEGVGTMPVGRRAARSGILLGRSDRCDGDALLSNPHISRVHVLIVEIAGSLYAIDTASKNGVWGHGAEERAQLLESGATFSLCGLARVEWRFFH
ncbi:MAG: hypothetical protein BMS9Abin37_3278 [Acidobacteriota bacterium]|nr:MAG: hypothetical protein BMS9Abin37_3278 [Acidobacteriota bacterium]